MLVEELAQNSRHVIASLVVIIIIISYMGIRSLIIDIFSSNIIKIIENEVKTKLFLEKIQWTAFAEWVSVNW